MLTFYIFVWFWLFFFKFSLHSAVIHHYFDCNDGFLCYLCCRRNHSQINTLMWYRNGCWFYFTHSIPNKFLTALLHQHLAYDSVSTTFITCGYIDLRLHIYQLIFLLSYTLNLQSEGVSKPYYKFSLDKPYQSLDSLPVGHSSNLQFSIFSNIFYIPSVNHSVLLTNLSLLTGKQIWYTALCRS